MERASSEAAKRTFCGGCGTQLTFGEDRLSETVDVTVGSLDSPELFPADQHIFVSALLPWLEVDALLPRFTGAHPRESTAG